MTRLTSLALDLSISISKVLAAQTLCEIEQASAEQRQALVLEVTLGDSTGGIAVPTTTTQGAFFARSMLNMSRILQTYQSWNMGTHHVLASVSLADTIDLVLRFNTRQNSVASTTSSNEVLSSFARFWMTITSVFRQKSTTSIVLDQKSIPGSAKLIASCMLLGQVDPPTPIDQLLRQSEHIRSALLELAQDEVTIDTQVGNGVAIALYDVLSGTLKNQDYEQLRARITSILDGSSCITPGSLEMMAGYTFLFPKVLVPELLKRIRRRSLGDKLMPGTGTSNAICVVTELMDKEFFLRVLPKDIAQQRSLLENALIKMLRDKEINTKLANKVSLALEPGTIFAALSSETIADDIGSSSRVGSILIDYLICQRKDKLLENTFDAFIDYIRSTSRSLFEPMFPNRATSPTQLLSMAKVKASDTNSCRVKDAVLDNLFNVVKKLGETIPRGSWTTLLHLLISKTYALPADYHLIRIWNNLAASIASSPGAIMSLSNVILKIMEEQGVVTEDLLERALDVSDYALEDLQLVRLSPLLILKAIPTTGFSREYKNSGSTGSEDNNIQDRMSNALASRYENMLEFVVVRTMAKTVFHSMFSDSSLEAIYTGMIKCQAKNPVVDSQQPEDLAELRSWLFTLYDWVVNWTIEARSPAENEHSIMWLYRIVSESLFTILSIHNSGQDGLDKMKLGVTDVLSKIYLIIGPYYSSLEKDQCRGASSTSRTMAAERALENEPIDLDNEEATTPFIPKTFKELFMAILEESLSQIADTIMGRNKAHVTNAVCLVNALVMAFQNTASLNNVPSSIAAPGSTRPANALRQDASSSTAWIQCVLLDSIVPRLNNAVVSYLQEQDYSRSKKTMVPLIQGCIQLLYTGTSILGLSGEAVAAVRSPCMMMMNITIRGLESEETVIAMAALKLLAAIVAARMVSPGLIAQADVNVLQGALVRLNQSKEMQKASSREMLNLVEKVRALI
ncbi:hypothetical protein BGZ65_006919 [Modicella reniformis]|uniref:Uncharacterized protein n=1 Tax=Modicella reniformis TaxID=1440133 RepID=A0A9P6LTP8_9FUNG|nr:hypothetical protein BGZ65_006919 [Modicella reniformis]